MLPILSVIFSALTAVIALVALRQASSAALLAHRAAALPQALQAGTESGLTSLKTRLDEVECALETLANKVKMQRVRTAANHVREPEPDPDPFTNPEGWRRATNLKLAQGKLKA